MYKFVVSASAFGIAALLVALVLAMPVGGSGTGLEAANAPEGCEKIQGTIHCEETENVGNAPEDSNSQQTTTTTSKKGSVNSSHETQEECEGPPGQCK